MPNFPRVTLLALAAAAALMMTGCFDQSPAPTPSPAASSTSVFASEEEALAAATEAYAAYLTVSDQILADGGEGVDRLLSVATQSVTDAETEGADQFSTNGWRLVGNTTFDRVSLQQFSRSAAGNEEMVTVYLCDDVSDVDVLDASGASVVTEGRPNRTPFQVGFQWDPGLGHLVVSSSEPWSGEDFCA